MDIFGKIFFGLALLCGVFAFVFANSNPRASDVGAPQISAITFAILGGCFAIASALRK